MGCCGTIQFPPHGREGGVGTAQLCSAAVERRGLLPHNLRRATDPTRALRERICPPAEHGGRDSALRRLDKGMDAAAYGSVTTVRSCTTTTPSYPPAPTVLSPPPRTF